ncbi:hypothetical protein BLNAU_9561 [Blattamonas nauphoetae]|uniref:Uncharacterized protein n=1 Tax=Blattamonas nauphoetae TaxID=2049346 RepID=A0ABQ9XVK7_9EUKA|nr:hypothetical protein BLNAU_9561 [Blattamonas nauphoetae]
MQEAITFGSLDSWQPFIDSDKLRNSSLIIESWPTNVKKDGKSEDLLPTDTPTVHLTKRPSISTAASPIDSPIQAQPSSSQDKPQPTPPPPVVPLQPQTQTPQRVASPQLEKRDDVKNDSFVSFPEKWELTPVEECVQAELQLLHPLATTPPSSPLSIILPPRLDENVIAELKKNKTAIRSHSEFLLVRHSIRIKPSTTKRSLKIDDTLVSPPPQCLSAWLIQMSASSCVEPRRFCSISDAASAICSNCFLSVGSSLWNPEFEPEWNQNWLREQNSLSVSEWDTSGSDGVV